MQILLAVLGFVLIVTGVIPIDPALAEWHHLGTAAIGSIVVLGAFIWLHEPTEHTARRVAATLLHLRVLRLNIEKANGGQMTQGARNALLAYLLETENAITGISEADLAHVGRRCRNLRKQMEVLREPTISPVTRTGVLMQVDKIIDTIGYVAGDGSTESQAIFMRTGNFPLSVDRERERK